MSAKHVPTGIFRVGALAVCLAVPAVAPAADRDTLLTEPGVYGTFAAFRIDADWSKLELPARIAHLTALPYHKTVKRKLYHATGLDDFHGLILSLNKVKEARHNRRVGNPTLVGTVRTLVQLIEVLAQ